MDVNRGPWADRQEAGRELGKAIYARLSRSPTATPDQGQPTLVLGLPRGGVVVAAEVARVIGGELDVLVVRKAGVPWHPELALGAVTAAGTRVINPEVITRTRLSEQDVENAFGNAVEQARVRERDLRRDRAPVDLSGRVVVLVDDGLATGATALAAAQLARNAQPPAARVMLAAPVGPPDTVTRLRDSVDDLVVLAQPAVFAAVGEWFADFAQVDDHDVQALLDRAGA